MIQKTYLIYIIKICNFQGEITDISAVTQPLHRIVRHAEGSLYRGLWQQDSWRIETNEKSKGYFHPTNSALRPFRFRCARLNILNFE